MSDLGKFGSLDLKSMRHTVPAGAYDATMSAVTPTVSADGLTLWLNIALELHDKDGVIVGQVEDRFLAIGAVEGSKNAGRVPAGLKRLALYGNAAGVDLDGHPPDDLPALLTGAKVKAVISRRGEGIQAENAIVSVKAVD